MMEAALRFYFYHSKDFAIEMWKYAAQLKVPISDSDLSFTHVPNGHAFLMGVDVHINSHGLRDREYSVVKAPGTYRILMLGDSTTFGWGVQLEETIPKLLESRLNEGRLPGIERFEVLNAGVGNYNAERYVSRFFKELKDLDPTDIVVHYFLRDGEDPAVALAPGTGLLEQEPPGPRVPEHHRRRSL